MSFPGFGELAVVLVIVLIIFGPGKLPQVFESLGIGIRKFREGAQAAPPEQDVTPPGKAALDQKSAVVNEAEVVEKEKASQ